MYIEKIVVDSPGITNGLTADHRGCDFGEAVAFVVLSPTFSNAVESPVAG